MAVPYPTLPYGQIGLMIYSWISFFIYATLIYLLMKNRHRFSSPFYTIVIYNSLADFGMFFHVELLMRPRRYRFFGIFNENIPSYIPYLIYGADIAFRNGMILGYPLFAANRFTAFVTPFSHVKLWTNKFILKVFIALWSISLLLSYPIYLIDGMSLIYKQNTQNGLLQMIGDQILKWEDYLCCILTMSSVIICILLYTIAAYSASRYKKLTNRTTSYSFELKMLVCSILTFIPLMIEMIRSIADIYSIYVDNPTVFLLASESWYYVTEVSTSLQCWTLLLVSPQLRSHVKHVFIIKYCRSWRRSKFRMRVMIVCSLIVCSSASWFGWGKDSNSEETTINPFNDSPQQGQADNGNVLTRFIPDFILDASPQAKKELFTILRQTSVPVKQIINEVAAWAVQYQLTPQVVQFRNKFNNLNNAVTADIQSLISVLPNTLNRLTAIGQNTDLSPDQMYDQATTFFGTIGELNEKLIRYILARVLVEEIFYGNTNSSNGGQNNNNNNNNNNSNNNGNSGGQNGNGGTNTNTNGSNNGGFNNGGTGSNNGGGNTNNGGTGPNNGGNANGGGNNNNGVNPSNPGGFGGGSTGGFNQGNQQPFRPSNPFQGFNSFIQGF